MNTSTNHGESYRHPWSLSIASPWKRMIVCSLSLAFLIAAPVQGARDKKERKKSIKSMRTYFSRQFKAMESLEPTIDSGTNNDLDPDLFETEEMAQATKEGNSHTWSYQAFMIRVRPELGFKIPGMVTLSIVPESEFYWSRQ